MGIFYPLFISAQIMVSDSKSMIKVNTSYNNANQCICMSITNEGETVVFINNSPSTTMPSSRAYITLLAPNDSEQKPNYTRDYRLGQTTCFIKLLPCETFKCVYDIKKLKPIIHTYNRIRFQYNILYHTINERIYEMYSSNGYNVFYK